MKLKMLLLTAAALVPLYGGECDIARYGKPPIPETAVESYAAKGGVFTLSVPQGWSRSEERFEYEAPGSKTVGLRLRAPADSMWVSSEISVIYYEYGGFFTDYRDYIRRERLSFNRQDDDAKTLLAEVSAGGRKGVAFEIETVEAGNSAALFEEKGIMYRIDSERIPKMVRMVEKYRVFPFSGGFVVFHYKASEASVSKCEGVFDRIVQSARFAGEGA